MAGMDVEIEQGKKFFEEGLIVEAYMDRGYTRTFMILEAESVEVAKARFDTYPQVAAGLIEFEYTPLVGMPAVRQSLEARGLPMPAWWPGA